MARSIESSAETLIVLVDAPETKQDLDGVIVWSKMCSEKLQGIYAAIAREAMKD